MLGYRHAGAGRHTFRLAECVRRGGDPRWLRRLCAQCRDSRGRGRPQAQRDHRSRQDRRGREHRSCNGKQLMRSLLESTMTLHMLVQLPLLALIGCYIGKAWCRAGRTTFSGRALALTQTFNAGGITGLIVASFVMVFWMLPRFLDLARLDPVIDAIKFASVPIAGLCIALSWPRLHVIARAVV